MKRIEKLIAGLVLIVVFILQGISLQAQPGNGRGQHGNHGKGMSDSCHVQLMIDDLSKELSLSNDQKQKITEIHYAHKAEVRKINNQYPNDCVGARDARMKLREKMDADVKALLNDDQKVKYDEFISNRRGPHSKGQGGKGNGNGSPKK